MTGSLRWFRYTTDAGDNFGIFADESNVESANGAAAAVGLGTIIYAVPRNVEVRTATYRNAAGTISRRVPVLTPAVTLNPNFNDPASGETVVLQSISGEALSLVSNVDTGLIDGDNP